MGRHVSMCKVCASRRCHRYPPRTVSHRYSTACMSSGVRLLLGRTEAVVHCQRTGPTSWGDGESCPRGGRFPWSAYGGWQLRTDRAQQLGGRGVLPRWRSVPTESLQGIAVKTARAHQLGRWGVLATRQSLPKKGLRGMAVPNGPGPLARGTGSAARAAVSNHGGLQGIATPNGPGPPAWGTGSPA